MLALVELTRMEGRRVSEYSLGQRQRLGVASAILARPSVLILDEPTSGLDALGIGLIHRIVTDLAAQGWSVSEAAGLSLESGQAAVVIYWEHTLYNTRRVMRCVASLDAALVETNEICSQPMAGLQSP